MPINTSKGRAAGFNTPNRFERLHVEPLDITAQAEYEDEEAHILKTTFLRDSSKTILAKNDSPDIPFSYSLNPYRGCEHGCIYCYARPSHEYLGFSAGLDFETKILVKEDAPQLLDAHLRKKSWVPQMVCMSGNTDCYQPAERMLKITRKCLEVFLNFRNPVSIITKNALVTRDIDILSEMAKFGIISVAISMSSLDPELTAVVEPRTSRPHKRLDAIRQLTAAGVPVHLLLAPVIPGLTDEEIPSVVREAAAAGATTASFVTLRLPGAVEPLFLEWIQRVMPERAAKILNRVRDTRGGELTDMRFGKRMTGEGKIAETISRLFKINREKYGLQKSEYRFDLSHFRVPPVPPGETDQIELF